LECCSKLRMGSGADVNVRGTSSAAKVASTTASDAAPAGPGEGWSFTCVASREGGHGERGTLGGVGKNAVGTERDAGSARVRRKIGGYASGTRVENRTTGTHHVAPRLLTSLRAFPDLPSRRRGL